MSQLVRIDSLGYGAPHIYLATPATTLHSNYVLGLVRSLPYLQDRGIAVTYALLTGYCHVDDARNILVRDFIDSPCTDLVFVDADIGWSAQSLEALARMPHGVVGGVYPMKGQELKYPVRTIEGAAEDEHGAVKCLSIPTGFMKINRSVIMQMAARQAEMLRIEGRDVPVLFQRGSRLSDDGPHYERVSGDVNFCLNWRNMGGTVHYIPNLIFTHQGTTDFVGRFAEAKG